MKKSNSDAFYSSPKLLTAEGCNRRVRLARGVLTAAMQNMPAFGDTAYKPLTSLKVAFSTTTISDFPGSHSITATHAPWLHKNPVHSEAPLMYLGL